MMLYPLDSGGSPRNEKDQVAAAVESFRKAIIDANETHLSKLLDDDLSYGHSDGHVEGKKEVLAKFSDGTYDFVTMEFSEQSISISENVAIVRNRLDGNTNDGGKPNEAHLFVLLVWHKTNDGWKLLARQAVKRLMQ